MLKYLNSRIIQEFMIRAYFGDGDPLSLCISRAYRDFCRTLAGVSHFPYLRDTAMKLLYSGIEHLNIKGNQESFDEWHQQQCENLTNIYAKQYPQFTVGHAQKWLNMTLKYLIVFGEEQLPGYEPLYPFFHIPIDNVMLDALASYGYGTELGKPWSKITDYKDEYMPIQQWVRRTFPYTPIEVEFYLWLHRQLPSKDEVAE